MITPNKFNIRCGSEARTRATGRFLKNLLGTPKGTGAKEAKFLVAGATTYLGAHCVRKGRIYQVNNSVPGSVSGVFSNFEKYSTVFYCEYTI